MEQSLCRKYGFNEAARIMRLQLVGLGPASVALGKQLHELIIAPHRPALVEAYYQFIFSEPELAAQLNGVDLPALKTKQSEYLETLGIQFQSETYFEQRLRIGQAHARVHLPLSLYHSAYLYLQSLLIAKVREKNLTPKDEFALIDFIQRIITLDMTLASDTYLQANVEGLEKTLNALVDEKDQLTSSVNHDTLTGVASRAFILARAKKQIEEKPQQAFSVIFADIDHFKKINDSHGHAVGDEVLKAVCQRMMHELREKDLVGRLGGEEFLILVPQVGISAALIVAERLRERLMQSPIHSHDQTIPVTMSFGVAEWQPPETLDDLVARADQALYDAKHAGRNCVMVAGFDRAVGD